MGHIQYDTFVEDDFNIIFDHYIYSANARSWASYDFGKANCSEAHPKNASSFSRVVKTWAEKVILRTLRDSGQRQAGVQVSRLSLGQFRVREMLEE